MTDQVRSSISILTTDMGTCMVTLTIYEGCVTIWYVWNRFRKARNSLFWKQMMVASILQVLGLFPMLVYGYLYTAFAIQVMPLTSYGPWIITNGYFAYTVARVDQLMVIKRALNPDFSSGLRWKNAMFWTIESLTVISNLCFLASFANLPVSITTPLFQLNNAILVVMHLINLISSITAK